MIERSGDNFELEAEIIPPAPDSEEGQFENTLRPKRFSEYIGQAQIKTSLELAVKAAKERLEQLDHVLLYGPPGLGKTTLANVIANEMGGQVRVTTGPAIERAGDLASLLTNLQNGDVLFIDEVHRLSRVVEEMLYSAMEDYVIDIMLGKGPTAQTLRLDLPKFTLVGATTRFGGLSGPFRDRFGLVHRLDYYTEGEIEKIVKRSAKIMDLKLTPAAAKELARRARLTPRIANRLLKRVRDYAQVHGNGEITPSAVEAALDLLAIDALGLDQNDRQLLGLVIDNFRGGPVGVEALAAAMGEERQTIEDVYEPFLLQIGLLERTARGRKASQKAYIHLGVQPPETPEQASLL